MVEKVLLRKSPRREDTSNYHWHIIGIYWLKKGEGKMNSKMKDTKAYGCMMCIGAKYSNIRE